MQVGASISNLAAYSQRILEFSRLAREGRRHLISNKLEEMASPSISLVDLNLVSPDQQCYIRDLNLYIERGRNAFITGPNGSGKTSLVRLIMGLWKPTRGRVLIGGGAQLACAPQEAVLFTGTLLEQLGLPNEVEAQEEVEGMRLLGAVRLSNLVARSGGWRTFKTRSQWHELLSPGEVQRVMLARILLRAPHFAILDEATSAIDLETEALIYAEFWRRGITTISIGHRLDAKVEDNISVFVTLDGQGNYFVRNQGEQLIFGGKARRPLHEVVSGEPPGTAD